MLAVFSRKNPGLLSFAVPDGAAGSFKGGITNTGAITASDSYGLYVYDVGGSSFSGGVINGCQQAQSRASIF